MQVRYPRDGVQVRLIIVVEVTTCGISLCWGESFSTTWRCKNSSLMLSRELVQRKDAPCYKETRSNRMNSGSSYEIGMSNEHETKISTPQMSRNELLFRIAICMGKGVALGRLHCTDMSPEIGISLFIKA